MAEQVLVVAAQYPAPIRSGGQVRTAQLVRALGRRFSVSLTGLYPADQQEAIPKSLAGCEVCVPVPVGPGWQTPLRRLRELGVGLLGGLPPAVARFLRFDLERAIASLGGVDAFDAVVCEYTAAGLYVPPRPRRRTLAVLDEIDVSWVSLERRAAVSRGIRRATARLGAAWMRRYEQRLFRSFDVVLVVSERDGQQVRAAGGAGPVWTVPNGVSLGRAPRRALALRRPACVFLGGMGHLPNRDAVAWLRSDILPRLRSRLPTAELLLIGEGTQSLSDTRLGVRGLGFVAELSQVLAPGDVGIAPIRVAGGTRLKLLEFMALGIPTVSTTMGAEGLDVISGEHLLLADAPEEIAARTAELLVSEELRAMLAKKARRLAEERYDWETIGTEFADRLAGAIDERRAGRLRIPDTPALWEGTIS